MFLRRVYITAFIERSELAVYSGQIYSCIQKYSSILQTRRQKCKDSMNLACQTHYRKQTSHFEIVYLSCKNTIFIQFLLKFSVSECNIINTRSLNVALVGLINKYIIWTNI